MSFDVQLRSPTGFDVVLSVMAAAKTQEANFNSAYVAKRLRRKKQRVMPEPQIVLEANDDDEAITLVIQQFLRVAA